MSEATQVRTAEAPRARLSDAGPTAMSLFLWRHRSTIVQDGLKPAVMSMLFIVMVADLVLLLLPSIPASSVRLFAVATAMTTLGHTLWHILDELDLSG